MITMVSKTSIITFINIFFIFTTCSSSSTPSTHFSKIYAFGDSYTDTGNTKSNLPYGMTFFHKPSNRLSDGRLVIDFVTETLHLPYLTSYLNLNNHNNTSSSHGVNFAVSGATAIDHEFYVTNNITLAGFIPQSISNQLVWFNKFLESHGCGVKKNRKMSSGQCRALVDDALFWVGEIGANDYAYILGSSVSPALVQDLAVKSVTGVLQGLLKKGAKYIVVQGLPMIGCLSMAMTIAPTNDRDDLGCVASANKQSYTHNLLLQSKIQDLRKQYPGTVISYADHWNAYRTIMKNQAGYGFKEPFKACCGSSTAPYNFEPFAFCGSQMSSQPCANPTQFMNWDGVHLTESMYKVVADLLLHQGYCDPSIPTILGSKHM
ncbi:GDSL esterase/lipase [Thalictrum thalictroides]|uniref:GDSL esterase/lipase n=1 Tax=Thalictrum thalictroides TaxID=46969 RepID=A0A7J6X8V6_THATH|nr:GDSL esterase/lipase [Thalictrum thalictroides]